MEKWKMLESTPMWNGKLERQQAYDCSLRNPDLTVPEMS